jgi:flagellar basal body-associated protein FliL
MSFENEKRKEKFLWIILNIILILYSFALFLYTKFIRKKNNLYVKYF